MADASMKIQAEFYEGSPIGIDLPPSMELTVTADRADIEERHCVQSQQTRYSRKRSNYHSAAIHQ